MLMAEINPTPSKHELLEAFHQAWCAMSSASPRQWSPENAAWGQCAVTALVVQDYWGGELLRGQMPSDSHYWNRLDDGQAEDFTLGQFAHPPTFSDVSIRTRETLLANEGTKSRYNILVERVKMFLAKGHDA